MYTKYIISCYVVIDFLFKVIIFKLTAFSYLKIYSLIKEELNKISEIVFVS
jgi:hypothetical protein